MKVQDKKQQRGEQWSATSSILHSERGVLPRDFVRGPAAKTNQTNRKPFFFLGQAP